MKWITTSLWFLLLILFAGEMLFGQEDPLKFPNSNEFAELSAILKDPNRSDYDKTYSCKLIARKGTVASVPILVEYLNDPKLSHSVQIALLQIPGDDVDKELCATLANVSEINLLPGLLRTIGLRKSPASVAAVVPYLEHADLAIFTAATDALSTIGNASSLDALKAVWPQGDIAQEDVVRKNILVTPLFSFADHFVREGHLERALPLYHLVADEKALLPRLRGIAVQGTILASQNVEREKIFWEAFNSSDPEIFKAALQTISQIDANQFVAMAIKKFDSFDKGQKILLLGALKQLKNHHSVDFVLNLATTKGDVEIRNAALDAFGNLGNVTHAPLLFESVEEARTGDWSVVVSILNCLGKLPDPAMNGLALDMLRKKEGPFRSFMINLAQIRALQTGIPVFLEEILSTDEATRVAACQACSALMSIEELPLLFDILPDKTGEVKNKILEAIRNVVARTPDKEQAARMIVECFSRTDHQGRFYLFDVLAQTDTSLALDFVATAINDVDSEVQDNALRVLGNWPNKEAAPFLLESAKNQTSERLQIRALRGYIRLMRQMEWSAAVRIKMAQEAFPLAKRAEENNLILEALGRAPVKQAFQIILPWLDQEATREAAAAALVEIGKKISVNDPTVEAGLKQVIERSTTESTKQMAIDLLKGIVITR